MENKTLGTRWNIWRYRFVRHLSFWVVPFLGFFLLVGAFETWQTALQVALTVFLPAPVTAYLHFFVLRRFFESRRYLHYAALVVVIVSLSSVLTSLAQGVLVSDETSRTSGVGVAILVILLSTGIHYFSQGMRQQYRLQEAEAKQLQAELAILRTQLHPHFLFNTLNSLYALALDRSDQMPNVVLTLSQLLRYSLDTGEHSLVPLAEEIRFIENYVALEELRLDRKANLSLEVLGSPDGHEVAPMLLAPFVENAFKHSDLGMGDDAFIMVRLVIQDDRWQLTVTNSHAGDASHERSGLGLANVRRRLELLNPDSHRLEIQDDGNRFQAVLEVRS